MKEQNHCASTSMPARVGLVVFATAVGLLLTLTVVAAQTMVPNFDSSYKTGPQYARSNDVITYTIVAMNTGAPAQGVVLSDVLPGGALFVPGSCTYDDGDGVWNCDDPPNQFWRENFAPGKRITTTFAVTVTAGTLWYPLVNHAYLGWDGGQREMVFTTTILSALPDFTSSYKTGPAGTETGDVITHTIVVVNSGDPVTDVVLSDTLPIGALFAGCTYDIGGATAGLPCTPPVLWQEGLDTGGRITTTIVFTVTAGTIRWPLCNCAHLSWNIMREEICFTTVANIRVYLPLVMRHWNPRHDVYEPNDTPDQAWGPLESGQVYAAYIWDAADQDDYYHFTPSATQTAQITLTHIPDNCDYDLYVYDYDGQYNEVASSKQTGNVDENVAFPAVAGERYYIRIFQYSGFSDQQPYHLIATYQ